MSKIRYSRLHQEINPSIGLPKSRDGTFPVADWFWIGWAPARVIGAASLALATNWPGEARGKPTPPGQYPSLCWGKRSGLLLISTIARPRQARKLPIRGSGARSAVEIAERGLAARPDRPSDFARSSTLNAVD